MSDDEVRKQFEKLAQLTGTWLTPYDLTRATNFSQFYMQIETQRAWRLYRLSHASQQARIDALEAKLAEVSKDAERYAWLRDKSKADIRTLLGISDFQSFDSFIDEAIKKDKP